MFKNKAIFLDRDGVINSNSAHYYIYKINDFEVNPGVIKSLKKFIDKGYILIIISNQGGISKGIYNIQDVLELNNHIIKLFQSENIKITDNYFCPHHSDLENCICRKPDSLLIEKALFRYNIDKELSYLIGDSDRDIKAAEKVGLKSVKIQANQNLYHEIKKSKYSFLVL